MNQIINGDCLEVMKGFEDKSIDLIVTDPPYGMEYQSAWRTATPQFEKIKNDESLEWVKPFLQEAYRVLKDDSHIYFFCNDYAISDFRREMEATGFTPKRTLVWLKNNHTSGDLEGDYGNKTEFCLFAHKGRKELNGRRDTNVLTCARVSDMEHPTQKPVELCKYLIEKSSNKGDLVLDPFAGSGSTLVAARALGRNYLGIELQKEYCDVAQKRVESVTQSMF